MRIDVYSHAIRVTGVTTDRDLQAMFTFCKPLIEMGLEKKKGRFYPKPLRTYASATRNRREFGFHRNQLDKLKDHLFRNHGYVEHLVPITHHAPDMKKVVKTSFPWANPRTPRDYQIPIVDYVVSEEESRNIDPYIRMVTLQTGLGKTSVAQFAMERLGWRTILHFKGGYLEQWRNDMENVFSFKKGDFLIVRGAKDMIALQQMALDGDLKAKVIIITTATMRDYIKDYEESNGKSKKFPIKPMDFYPTLGVGLRVNDEFHQEFHNNFRMDLYTQVPRSLALSATMLSSDAFKNRMYEIACPTHQRNDGGGYKVYIGVVEVQYYMDDEVSVPHMGAQGYSHTTYEGGLMRHKGILKNYFKIIESAFYERYVQLREEGQKALIFFATVDMCTMFVERLQKLYPELDIVRYAGSEGDSYEDMVAADVAVSTLGSAGTAVDIPNLRVTLMTTAIESRQSNEQALGRTRTLKDWPDVTPEFIYFTCTDIEKHVDYSRNKINYFKGKILYHNVVMSRYSVTKSNHPPRTSY